MSTVSKQSFIGEYGKESREIELEERKDGGYTVSINGQSHTVDACRFEGGTWSLIIDGNSYDVELEVAGKSESEGQYVALVRGSVIEFSVQDERKKRLQLQDSTGSKEGPQVVNAPMPGKIVKILVQEGQEVTENQAIIVIEAMKMENELRAVKDGVISKIMVSEGDTVEGNTKLITIT